MIAPLAYRFGSVLDGLLRTGGEAGHAVGALLTPDRSAVLERDVGAGADPGALAAGDAGVGGVKVVGLDEILIIQLVDRHRGGQGGPAGLLFGDDAPQGDDLRRLVDDRDRVLHDPAARIAFLDGEENGIVRGHPDAGAAVIDHALFLRQPFGEIARAAHLAGGGENEENVAAARQGRGPQPVGQQPGHLRHIDRRHHDPGLFRMQRAVIVRAELFQQAHGLVADALGDAPGGKGAVARRRKVQNHTGSPSLPFIRPCGQGRRCGNTSCVFR